MLQNRSQIEELLQAAWMQRFDNRERCLEQSVQGLEQAKEVGHVLAQGLARRNIAFCLFRTGDHAQALHHLDVALEVARNFHDQKLERDCLQNISYAYASLGEFEAAIDAVFGAYRINIELEDVLGMIWSLNNISGMYHQLGDNETSLEYASKAIERCESIGDLVRKASSLTNQGIARCGLGRYPEAIKDFEDSLAITRDLELKDFTAQTLVNLAEALSGTGAHAKALETLDEALEMVRANKQTEGVVYCLLNAAKIELAQRHSTEAIQYADAAIEAAQDADLKLLEFQCFEIKAQAYKQQNSFEQALTAFEEFHRLEKEVRDDAANRKMRVFNAQREAERLRGEAKLEQLRNVELMQALEALEQANQAKTTLLVELEEKTSELELLVLQDPLTRLYNRRHLENYLTEEFSRATLGNHPLPVAMLDVDDFKYVNDTFGHLIGDQVLQHLAGILHTVLRSSDMPARYGGEEFAFVLPRSTPQDALIVCERIRSTVEKYDWEAIQTGLKVTVSIGMVWDTNVANFEKLISRADDRLYEAKRYGKNLVRNDRLDEVS
jgi:diguanylate cyclase (GGDEF)-like protein